MICECGCGKDVKEGNRFINGHHRRGKKLSAEHKKRISKSMKGRKISKEHMRKLAEINKDNKYALGYRHSNEAKKKISGCQIGEKHHNWRGGTSFAPYCPKFNNIFKESIREKFNRKCFLCGEKENGRKLSVHHVNYDKECLCNDIKCEFVPLCMSCHNKTSNGDREYYEALILEKLLRTN